MNRRPGIAIVLGLAVVAVAFAGACFPDFALGPGGDAGAGDGGGRDATTSDSAIADGAPGDTSLGDGMVPGPDGPSPDAAPLDGPTGPDASDAGIPPWDGSLLATEVVIEGGTFYFQVQDSDGGLVDAQVTLDYDFAIDRTEVTVARFQAFVAQQLPLPEAGTVLDPSYPTTMTWDPTWNSWAQDQNYASASCNEPGGKGPTYDGGASLPMNCVAWEEALSFCWWDHGRRLPTDTEWHVVATSGGARSPYPWGTQAPDCSYAVFNETSADCNWPVDAGSTPNGVTPTGVYDIAGSLSEWVWDWLAAPYVYPAVATDYTGPTPQSGDNSRLWIGGSYWEPAAQLVTSQGAPSYASTGGSGNYDALGFRCVRSLH